jgi:zinc D-Ala-D-Ala carboxypeptidase
MRLRAIIISILAVFMVLLAIVIAKDTASAPNAPANQHLSSTSIQPAGFNKHLYSTTDPTSIWIVVNKQHPLNPKTYVPPKLVIPAIPLRANITGDEQQVSSIMAPALEQMAAAAKKDGMTINLQSGYRSYNFQVNLYNSYVNRDGQVQADHESARPGYSEHQTGFAADLGGVTTPSCNVAQCFADTPEGKWLAAHAWEFGFIIRYTAVKQPVTGYEDEPWHVRYIGTALSQEMHTQGIATLEEFFGITGGETYLN